MKVTNNNKPLNNKDIILNRNKDMYLKNVSMQERQLYIWMLVLVTHTPTTKPNKKKLFKLNRTTSGNNACLSTQNS